MGIESLSSVSTAPPMPQPTRSTEAVSMPVQTSTAAQQQKAEPSLEEVKRAASLVQDVIQAKASNLTFAVAQDAGKTIVRLTDKQSGEVILQIPSKEMIAIASQIDKLAGMFVQQKV